MDPLTEVWKDIPEFPRYAISNLGRVMNLRTDMMVKPQMNPQGIVYVPLYGKDKGYTRSIKVLVAKAFLEIGEYDPKIFDTPINKDGDKTNNKVSNLLWRPRWFAVKYSRQFITLNINAHIGPVYDMSDGKEYDNVYVVATTFGLLIRNVYMSSYSSQPVFPTNQIFSIPDPRHVR